MKKPFRLLIISVVFLSISSLSIALIPLYNRWGNGKSSTASYLGTVFLWLGIVGGYITLFLFIKQNKGIGAKGRIGAFSFFRNRYAFIADAVLILSLVLITVLALTKSGSMVIYSLLFGTVFLFMHLHCIFNGRVFHTLLTKKRSGKNG